MSFLPAQSAIFPPTSGTLTFIDVVTVCTVPEPSGSSDIVPDISTGAPATSTRNSPVQPSPSRRHSSVWTIVLVGDSTLRAKPGNSTSTTREVTMRAESSSRPHSRISMSRWPMPS